ncbi:MAG: hypothetical protein HZB31_12880 [Nitrospirae bacterium]|nr:hypothetical protein [Nitrospirota bacterium]
MKKIVVFLAVVLLFVLAVPIYAQVYNPANSHYYELIDNSLTWYEARDAAVTMFYNGRQGHLATITSSDENAFVVSQWPGIGNGTEVWIGGTDEASEGDWRWITGETWSYDNWNSGEPNNVGSGENCLDYKDDGAQGWNDAACDSQFWYLVEYEPVCTTPADNMIAWWKGDNNALDMIGTQHGTLMNSDTYAPGMVGQAFSFDGVDDYVDLPDGFANFTSGFTIGLWAKPTASGYWARFVDLGNGTANNNILFMRRSTSNDLAFEVYDGSGNHDMVYAENAITNNEWHYYAATMDAAGQVKLYKDGLPLTIVVDTTYDATTIVPTSVTRVNNYIGKSNWGADAYYTGSMDEIAIFNRALDASEIAAIYNAGSAGNCRISDPVITVTSPNGGEIWNSFTTHDITWTYTGNVGTSVNIELFKSGAFLGTIAANAPIGTDGAGSFNWAVPKNRTDSTYSVRITTNGQYTDTSDNPFTLLLAAPTACTYTITPKNASFALTGGNGSFAVTTQPGCAWTAVMSDTWITTKSSGTGSGTVNYSVAANAGTSRLGTITVNGQVFAITQSGAGTRPPKH